MQQAAKDSKGANRQNLLICAQAVKRLQLDMNTNVQPFPLCDGLRHVEADKFHPSRSGAFSL